MQTLKRLLLTASICCLMATVNAAPMDDAIAAYNKGDYKEALKIWRPLTDQGNALERDDRFNNYSDNMGKSQSSGHGMGGGYRSESSDMGGGGGHGGGHGRGRGH